MKKNLLNLLIGGMVLTSSVAIAQPTLTATGINPLVGESFTLYYGNYVSPGSPGASQTWDISTMSGSSGGLTSVVTPSSTTYGSNFTTSNIAEDNPTANTTNYYKTSASAYQNSGIVGGGVVFTYTDFEDLLHFPFTFNDNFSDPWAAEFFSGYQFWRTGTTTITADSYGTLITPNGTYSNVIRIHMVQTYQDSAYIGTPYIITYNNDQYLWFKEGIHLPLAGVYNLTSSASGPSTGGFYADGSVGIDEIENYLTSSSIFPNPANELVTINFELTANKKVNVMVLNSLGQEVKTGQTKSGNLGLNSVQVNVENLPKGVYFAQLYIDGNIAKTERFVVTR